MTKPKTLEQLRTEKERAETQLAQEQHKLNRLENRKKYLEKGERQKRTHRLCNLGGTVESLAPEVKDLTRTEMTELMEQIFSLSEVQRAVRHITFSNINFRSQFGANADPLRITQLLMYCPFPIKPCCFINLNSFACVLAYFQPALLKYISEPALIWSSGS